MPNHSHGSMNTGWINTMLEASEASAANTRICPTCATILGVNVEPARKPIK
ncbi:hypothetical protein D3C85_1809940 [compost metagenome]